METTFIISTIVYIVCGLVAFFYTYYYSGLFKGPDTQSRKEYKVFALMMSFLPGVGVVVTGMAMYDWWQRYRPIKKGHKVIVVYHTEETMGIPHDVKGVVIRAYPSI